MRRRSPQVEMSTDETRAMFGRVARRYDLANRVMTLGLDRRWRRVIQERARLAPGERLLDLATGTGQLALDARRRCGSASIVAADLTPEMLDIAAQRPGAESIEWRLLDARSLPFPDASFDVITHGYLLRYLTADMPAALREQWRVLQPGGRWVALESSPGGDGVIGRVAAHLTKVWPRLVGAVVASNGRDYGFLQSSTLAFMHPDEVDAVLQDVGGEDRGRRSFFGGMLTVHWATKPGVVVA